MFNVQCSIFNVQSSILTLGSCIVSDLGNNVRPTRHLTRLTTDWTDQVTETAPAGLVCATADRFLFSPFLVFHLDPSGFDPDALTDGGYGRYDGRP